ncbi:unnamed protein product [Thlaspi arvense]|uniref:Glucosamine inositolphosphorylceramide transferase 1 N-terminal domain-containing protein n=1 Tax=Thlaspi arvense TaxID=13288 RepID=A0AAU9RL75_THLAR|nr:unnamed protein product [Thlaspi arvense]
MLPYITVMQGDVLYLIYFLKQKIHITMQGDIGVARSLDKGVTWQHIGTALDEDWHLSYPYVFDYNGQIYMLPEGSAKGELRLYRALNFPLQWTLEKVIMKKPLVDPSLINHNGKYWIFGSDHSSLGNMTNGQLEIWYSSSPLGVMDGDRVPSADSGHRFVLGFGSAVAVAMLVMIMGMLVGAVKCIIPLSWCPHNTGKRSDVLLAWESSSLFSSKLRQYCSRLNNASSVLHGRIKPNTWAGKLVIILIFVVMSALMCSWVRFMYGGNGAQEAYPKNGHYSQFTMLTMTYDARLCMNL